jgi:hypothetical protein
MKRYLTAVSMLMYVIVCFIGIVNPLQVEINLKYVILLFAAVSLLSFKSMALYLWCYNIFVILFLLWYFINGIFLK